VAEVGLVGAEVGLVGAEGMVEAVLEGASGSVEGVVNLEAEEEMDEEVEVADLGMAEKEDLDMEEAVTTH
jgi:hypothetical protein